MKYHVIIILVFYFSVKYKADYQIQAGSNWVFFGSIHYCSKIIVHKSFDYISGDYDIALIKVSNPFKIGRVYTDAAALPAAGTRPKSNTMAKTAGWGIFTQIMGIPISSPYLRTVEVPIISKKKCARLYKKHSGSRNVSPRQVCLV